MFGEPNNERVVCKNGFSISVQASQSHYCEPRMNRAYVSAYTLVECGYPFGHGWRARMLIYAWNLRGLILRMLRVPSAWNELREHREGGGSTVYPYVPIAIVHALIRENGGMVSGEMPHS